MATALKRGNRVIITHEHERAVLQVAKIAAANGTARLRKNATEQVK